MLVPRSDRLRPNRTWPLSPAEYATVEPPVAAAQHLAKSPCKGSRWSSCLGLRGQVGSRGGMYGWRGSVWGHRRGWRGGGSAVPRPKDQVTGLMHHSDAGSQYLHRAPGEGLPRPRPVYRMGLEQADDALDEGVVVGICDAAYRGSDASPGHGRRVHQCRMDRLRQPPPTPRDSRPHITSRNSSLPNPERFNHSETLSAFTSREVVAGTVRSRPNIRQIVRHIGEDWCVAVWVLAHQCRPVAAVKGIVAEPRRQFPDSCE
ncbi:hypothetical protein D3C57_143920 [Streptomyces rapamycinicus NRRL 5491]|uniref:Uncharacterized protein n=1 Tax=Streptomyces rapamycinicus (strain ATCC 29253 / DSM 41530 / NRRL 5491 / AYB-994) TaxID=1343740 RepID=A0A3L8QWD9_STRRN|nr:hypothetical protein D3C57_143920 [Streptomyces rapamycinicus NRRL 5491]